jgi:hypothetical protein
MEGQRVSVYTTSLGRGLYLAVIVPKGTRQGLVWLYAKEAAVEIDRIVQRATDAMQRQLGHAVNVTDADAMRKEMADQKVENVFERRRTPPSLPPRLEHPPPPSSVSTISFRKDRPQPELKAEDSREEPAAEEAPSAPGISFDEAMKLGLLKDIAPESPAGASTNSEPEAASGGLTPDKFEEALLKGLFGE